VADALQQIAAMFDADPFDPVFDMPEEEQRAKATAASADARAAADAIARDPIGFDQASDAIRFLGALTGPDSPVGGPARNRTLKTALAKLSQATESMVPARIEEMHELEAKAAQERGYSVRHVGGQSEPLPRPPFSYTLGLQVSLDVPELATVGLDLAMSNYLFAELVEKVRAGERFTDGQRIAGLLEGGYEVMIRDASDALRGEMFGAATASGVDLPPAQQVLLPDAEYRFPGEPGCDEKMTAGQNYPEPPDVSDE
jgi:hypothetical protein